MIMMKKILYKINCKKNYIQLLSCESRDLEFRLKNIGIKFTK